MAVFVIGKNSNVKEFDCSIFRNPKKSWKRKLYSCKDILKVLNFLFLEYRQYVFLNTFFYCNGFYGNIKKKYIFFTVKNTFILSNNFFLLINHFLKKIFIAYRSWFLVIMLLCILNYVYILSIKNRFNFAFRTFETSHPNVRVLLILFIVICLIFTLKLKKKNKLELKSNFWVLWKKFEQYYILLTY